MKKKTEDAVLLRRILAASTGNLVAGREINFYDGRAKWVRVETVLRTLKVGAAWNDADVFVSEEANSARERLIRVLVARDRPITEDEAETMLKAVGRWL